MIGLILKKRYCILECLGRGGQGSVYLARDLDLGILRAVKELPLEKKHEAKLLRLMEHPAIPKIVDYFEKDDHCYLIMEYIQGYSLQQWMDKGRSFSLEEIMGLAEVLCKVLRYLHTRKPPVIYGDLKPENLMLTESGHLYLVDFGSAIIDYGKDQAQCMGTRGYAAPEQYEGKINESSDIYGFGKVLEALLGKGKGRILCRNLRLAVLLWKCTCKEIKLRPANISEVEAVLSKISGFRKKNNLYMLIVAAILSASVGISVFILYVRFRVPPLETALSEITEDYYSQDFLQGKEEKIENICAETEKKLQSLLKKYTDTEAQRRLLLLLAYNGELMGELQRAALYYEQLLLYEPECKEGYERYGQYLLRQGQKEQSERLLEVWEERKGEEEADLRDWLCERVYAMELGGFDVQIGAGENTQLPDNWEASSTDSAWGGGETGDGGQSQQLQWGAGSQTGEEAQVSAENQAGGEAQVSAESQTGGEAQSGAGIQNSAGAQTEAGIQSGGVQAGAAAESGGETQAGTGTQSVGKVQSGAGTQTGEESRSGTETPPKTTEVREETSQTGSMQNSAEKTGSVSEKNSRDGEIQGISTGTPTPAMTPSVPVYYQFDSGEETKKQGLKICYFRSVLQGDEKLQAEIQGTESFYPLSVRVNGREVPWTYGKEGIILKGLSEKEVVLQVLGVYDETETVQIEIN